MLGDWWCMIIKGKTHPSVRFYLEQGIVHSAYIKYCAKLLFDLGYSNSPEPVLVKKAGRSHLSEEKQFNYRIVTYTFTSLNFIYDSFYKIIDGKLVKVVPSFIGEYLTPFGLALWIMDDGSRQKEQGIMIATHSFSYEDVQFLANILTELYGLKTSVVKSGIDNQWRINIWKKSMPKLAEIVKPYMIPEMAYKLEGYQLLERV
uniref:LAGLIDADG endonuclease n=1 Tax=Parasitella parasitica TaxID=35722 RepID=A0A088SQH9_9FUNG|nr:LAGLIDADG endonuclease [Parasitella parasitica]AIO05735.1 LAGLIDADG endonuclease [Parasitella parasitica]